MADTNVMCIKLSKLAGEDMVLAAGTTDLTDAVSENIATGLSKVKFVIAGANANATTAGAVAAKIAAANDGTIDIIATGATGGASHTTTVNWFAIGLRS